MPAGVDDVGVAVSTGSRLAGVSATALDAGAAGGVGRITGGGTQIKLEYGREEALEKLVHRAATRANAHLLELMLGKYSLQLHLLNLKQYLLLGKGDFVQHLMEHLAPQVASSSS